MTILSVPSMIFYVQGNPTFTSDLKSLITAVSLGNIGSSKLTCDTGNSLAVKNVTDYSSTIQL
jgi:hypothetical protein